MSGHSRKGHNSGASRGKGIANGRLKLHIQPAVAQEAEAQTSGTPLYAPVLVLNASYEPINICAARRAIVLVLKGVAMTEEENGHYLHAQRLAMRLPSVIRLLEYRRIPHQSRALSRKNILLRDRNTCQYCGEVLSSGDLTLDHVVPRSRGGLSTWENLVACCHGCNREKGNQLLAETEMKLLREPRSFNLHTSRHIMRMIGRSDLKWRKYLFY
jgi:5-methylcytosine-specific restriction endonuclease McrA